METISSGGVEKRRLLLARGLDKNKYDFKIICTKAEGPVAEALINEGVELFVVGSFTHPFHISKHIRVYDIIKSYKPHIIHGAVFEGMTMAAIGGFISRVPIAILEETSDPQNRSKKANLLLKVFVNLSDKIIAISPHVAEYLHKHAGIDRKSIQIINNGLSIAPFPHSGNSPKKIEIGITEKDITIGFVGRLYNDHKRVTDLVEAISLINNYNIKLLIVGEGKDLQLIQDLVVKLHLVNQVIFVGYQENTDLYYSFMDILCIPSSREGFGLVAVEAMLHKLPVVASRVGGLKDIIVDGETGLLVDPLVPFDLSEKIRMLLDDSDLRRKMGVAGYKRAKENYSSERYVKEVEELYLDLLKSNYI